MNEHIWKLVRRQSVQIGEHNGIPVRPVMSTLLLMKSSKTLQKVSYSFCGNHSAVREVHKRTTFTVSNYTMFSPLDGSHGLV